MSRRANRAFSLFTMMVLLAAMLPATSEAALAKVPAAPAHMKETGPEWVAVQEFPMPAPQAETQERAIIERDDGVRYVAGELIVRFTPEVGQRVAQESLTPGILGATGVSALDELGVAHGPQAVEPVFHQHTRAKAASAWLDRSPTPTLGDVYRLTFPAGADVEQLAADYAASAGVVYAEPNYVFEFDDTVPDDPYFDPNQWHLENDDGHYGGVLDADIDAPEAWDVVTGTSTIVIAVIDTGVDRDHPDLDNHIWSNPGETPGNSIDDDGNGYVDDTWGWNWVSNLSDPDDYDFDDPRDDNGHGTHVAGIAAAETNNGVGVAGICWNCSIMSLKAFESNGTGTTSDIVQAIDYAADKGADVINMSFGSYAESLLLEDTLADAYGQAVLVAAAGNYGETLRATEPYYPASISYVLGVGATDAGCVDPPVCSVVAEHRAEFSNYGVNADVGAPGVSVYATFPGGGYASLSGTSMAAPIVSGLAALLLSHNPTWSKEMVRGQMIKTAEAIVGDFDRVNAYDALTVVPTPDLHLLDESVLYGDSDGDGDGIPDAGETFTATLQLKNYWAEALTTTAVLSTTDPYVTLISDTATFGDISAYATMRNEVTPFQMVLTTTAPNNHQVDFNLGISANGGAYNTSATFSFLVQRGIEIPDPLFPAVITDDLTLESDYLYIVKQNMLVSEGVTLTIEPGTRLQFDPNRFIRIDGTLVASGTEELPITFTSNQLDPQPGDFKGIVFGDTSVDAVLDATPITVTLVEEGIELPEIGTVVSISGTPRFDAAGDVYVTAIISGTPDYEQVLHWFNGVGIVEASSDPLPSGTSSTPFSETVTLTGGSPDRVIYSQPSLVYQGGSILNHSILEYGGGLLIDDSFPYVANCTFRRNQGAVQAGQSTPQATVTIDRRELTEPGKLVFRDSYLADNPGRAVYVYGNGPGWAVFSGNTIHNNTANGVMNPNTGAGVSLQGAGDGHLATAWRENVIEYNSTRDCSGILAVNYPIDRLRFIANHLYRNEANTLSYGGGGGCIRSAAAVIRRNVFASNVDHSGYVAGDSAGQRGGAALYLSGPASLLQFNTFVGNQAVDGPFGPDPGHTLFLIAPPASPETQVTRNNIVGNEASYDLYLSNAYSAREDVDARQNYWDTTDVNEIRYDHIYDYWQDFEPGEAVFQPFLTAPEPLAPGFLLDAATTPPSPIGAEVMTVTLDFSRDMNTAITPTVTFGVDEPYTQHTIENGEWISPTRWVGAYDVTIDTGDGINSLRVKDAEDADGMPIPIDTRFAFVIQTAGTQAILLEATASAGQVALNWTQNDVTDLAGYVLYRSPYTNTNYAQVGGGMFVTTAYTDTDVTNGTLYYYKYSILDTDLNEVAWSNEVSLTPDDYTLPDTPTVTDDGATTHYFDRLHGSWASDDPETGIAEYQYCIGTAVSTCDTVSWTSMGTLTETTKTSLNLSDGQIYYVNVKARNGADHWSLIGSSDGITVTKLPPPAIASVVPISGVRNTSHVVTLTGSGFQANPQPTVRFGSTALGSVSVISSTQLTATVPSGVAAGVYTATVTNYDTQVGTLASAYTATNPAVGPRTFLLSPSTQQVGDDEASATVDVRVEAVSDLGAFEFKVVFDPSVVHVSNVTLGAFLGSGGRSTSALGPDIDNVAGEVTFGGFSYGTGTGANGTGTLATITFSPQVTGTTGLTLENVIMADTLSYEIPADPQDGEIQVVHYPFGDLDRDCDVDIVDIMAVASLWNDPGSYDDAYDFDDDGDIDVLDIMQVAAVWGATCGGGGGGGMAALSMPLLQGDGDVLFEPPEATPETGTPFTMSVVISGAVDLGGFEFDLLFDPAVITVTDVSLGGLLESSGNTASSLGPLHTESGKLVFGGFSYGAHGGASGDGTLATLELVLLSSEETILQLDDVQLVTSGGVEGAPHSVGEGKVSPGERVCLPLVVRDHY